VGHLDEDGHLWVTSRLSHRIISGGENVDPEEVEAVFRTYPGVREVAVLGIPDPEWGERVVAAVVGEPRGLLDDLDRLARSVLSPAKRPKEVLRVPFLPRNPNGKIDRERIRRLFLPESSDGWR
jgi:acyl-CoA synthetase (AMP-forming)/AMP-acid ligase II